VAFFAVVSATHFFPPARRADPSPGLRAAALAAATVVGALIGFGRADGAALSRLGAVVLRLRGLPEFVAPDRGAVGTALVGAGYAAVTAGAWGASLAALDVALARRGAAPPWRLAAITLAALALAAADAVLPTPLRLAAGALGPGERVLTALLVAASAWAGVRMTAGAHDVAARAAN
jgi:hypothetical protein